MHAANQAAESHARFGYGRANTQQKIHAEFTFFSKKKKEGHIRIILSNAQLVAEMTGAIPSFYLRVLGIVLLVPP